MKAHGLAMRGGCIAVAAHLAFTGSALARDSFWANGFEGAEAGVWWRAGNAGIDVGKGLAHTGNNNGWARNTTGWNAINTWVPTFAGAKCVVYAWLRTSNTLTDGYISVRSKATHAILGEMRLSGSLGPNPGHANYNDRSFTFEADGDQALFYVGLWGNGTDAWVQVDDVRVTCRDSM